MELEPWVSRCNVFFCDRGRRTVGEEIDVLEWNANPEDGEVVV